jgi:hypothetical protein
VTLHQLAQPNGLGMVRQILVRQPRRAVPSTEQWLPGASTTAVASGGVEGVSYAHGLILGVIYVVVAIAAAMTVFRRNDVTA